MRRPKGQRAGPSAGGGSVRASGQINAEEGARRAGCLRKTYYEWKAGTAGHDGGHGGQNPRQAEHAAG